MRFDEVAMNKNFVLVAAAIAFGPACWNTPAIAAEPTIVALKSGETADLNKLFFVRNCRSLLKGKMTVEVLDGPPGLTASIREQQIAPRKGGKCTNAVDGGVLVLAAAKDIKAKVEAKAIIRVKYPTTEGDKQKALEFKVILLP
jgi:hypothetical protein